MEPTTKKKTPRDILRILFRRRNLFLISAWLFAFVALQLAVHYVPVKYTGMTKFERRAEPASDAVKGTSGFGTRKLTLEFELAGYNAIRAVVEELGMTQGLPHDRTGQLTQAGQNELQAMVNKLQENTTVQWEVRSENVDLISVSVVHKNPELAKKIPDTLVKNYIHRIYETTRKNLSENKDYLQERVSKVKDEIRGITDEKIAFEVEHADMMPDSPIALQERINDLQIELESAQRTQQTAEKKIARLDAMKQEVAATTQPAEDTPAPQSQPAEPGPLASTSTQPAGNQAQPSQVVMGPNPELARLEDQLQQYREQLEMMLIVPPRKTEAHPDVKAMRSMIAQLEEKIKNTPEEVVIQTIFSKDQRDQFDLMAAQLAMQRADAQAELQDARRRIVKLQAKLNKYEQLQQNFAPVRQEYMQIVNRLENKQAELDAQQAKLNDLQMALSAEIAQRRTSLNTVETAKTQFRPSSPSLLLVLGGSLVGGLAFGVGLVLLTVLMDRSFSSPDEAQAHFEIPVVGTIREIVPKSRQRMRFLRRLLFVPLITLLLLATLGVSIFNAVLWLHFPDEYTQWNAAPLHYLQQQAESFSKPR